MREVGTSCLECPAVESSLAARGQGGDSAKPLIIAPYKHLGSPFIGFKRLTLPVAGVFAVSNDDGNIIMKLHRQHLKCHGVVSQVSATDHVEKFRQCTDAARIHDMPLWGCKCADTFRIVGYDSFGPVIKQSLKQCLGRFWGLCWLGRHFGPFTSPAG